MSPSVRQLLSMPMRELDALFGSLEAGPIPDGRASGAILIGSGTRLDVAVATAVRALAWKGKVFDARAGVLRNRVLPVGLHAVPAKVYRGASRLDGRNCVVIDYSRTSLVAHFIRDEIRLVRPGLYLGRAYWGRSLMFDFALEF